MGIHPTRCFYCDQRPGIKTDSRGLLICGKCLRPTITTMRDSRIGRNDPCPCQSGKKFKKCCLRKGGA